MEINCVRIGKVAVIALADNFREENIPQFEERFQEMYRKGFQYFLIDMLDLDFICSAGMRAILKAYKQLMSTNGQLRLVRPTPQVFTPFETTHLDEVFDFYMTASDAILEWLQEPYEKQSKSRG